MRLGKQIPNQQKLLHEFTQQITNTHAIDLKTDKRNNQFTNYHHNFFDV